MALTRRQREILDFIAAFIGSKRYSPSLEEIAEHFSLASVATVHKHVTNLEKKGFIRRDWNRSRSIDLITTELPGMSAAMASHEDVVPFRARSSALSPARIEGAVEALRPEREYDGESAAETAAISRLPLLGRVAAGLPIEAIVDRETMAVPSAMVGKGRCYVLQVSGSSMIGEHIADGDFVIVEQRDRVRDGERVIALIGDGEATLKTFYREPDGSVRLEPANPAHQTLRVRDGAFRLQGVVIGVMRKYR